MLDWGTRLEAARGAAVEAGFTQRDADLIVSLSRPAARLVAAPGEAAPIGASKLGGLPDLPADVDWPRGARGPMLFCGQVNTADVAFIHGVEGWEPPPGLLSFFAAKEPDGWGIETGRVLMLADKRLERREAPPDLSALSRFDEAAFKPVAVVSPPEEALTVADLDVDLDADDWAAWRRLFEALGCGSPHVAAGHHQLLGNAWFIGGLDPVWAGAVMLGTDDGEEEDEDEASGYRLLAQFTSDQDANVEIADGGAIYFVIAAEDLAANSYERVSVHIDSC